ncbi:hypothetical protein ElyMa_004693100 [Elysia marginata]|uniref:Uncharacterized protein n=1 Tax=Elysia marginata TaxID=1093978 RepID=A0AAV4I7I0_9GAST|nr:hypothetical protein ElyMa_004693100 [Elysia marginata]
MSAIQRLYTGALVFTAGQSTFKRASSIPLQISKVLNPVSGPESILHETRSAPRLGRNVLTSANVRGNLTQPSLLGLL